MESIFLSIYDYFQGRRRVFWLSFILIIAAIGLGALKIQIEEDITRFFPEDERVEKLNYVFRNSKFAERLVVMVSEVDSTRSPAPDSLVRYAERLVQIFENDLKPFVKTVTSQVDDSKVMSLLGNVQDHLPIFLEAQDYQAIDSMLQAEKASEILEQNYRQLISPSGIITKKIIAKDPLGLTYLALNKLQALQYDSNVEVYDNYLISGDHRHLIFFVEPLHKSNETGSNAPFIKSLDQKIDSLSFIHPDLKASYFGATAVAVGNARQLQQDTIITMSLMILLLAVFLVGFFRKKRVPFLILVPVVFGSLFALCSVWAIQGRISIIAIAAGSIILGIAVNYSLHFLTHLRHVGDIRATLKDLVKPMTTGSATTVLAFFCLQFVNASVLRDVGLFAGFSLIGAALCSLIFLPHLVSAKLVAASSHRSSWMERLGNVRFESKKALLVPIVILTPVFLYFANDVSFNTDLSKMNYMEEDLAQAQARLEHINKASLTSVYIVSQASTLEGALRKNEMTSHGLKAMQAQQQIQKFSSVSSFLISDSLQRIRLERWNSFWQQHDVERMLQNLRAKGRSIGYSESVFDNFASFVKEPRAAAPSETMQEIRDTFFDDFIIEEEGLATVVTLANVSPHLKKTVYQKLSDYPSNAFDRMMITNMFGEFVHEDFKFIVAFTSILVFAAMLLIYGRIELTLITFVPMLITWIWILGLMAIIGIEFNIVNVMVSTFIFGLGDDYSIFTMDGLQREYSVGKKNIASIRTSILLSALTTISGLGVLIFAAHPALKSIAGISIIGIVCVFVMSQTLEPYLFRWLILNRTSRGLSPMTFIGIFRTVFIYSFFILGSFLLTIIGVIFKIIPFGKRQLKNAFHWLIRLYTAAIIKLDLQVKVKVIGRADSTFDKPSIVISNHSSFLDILLTAMQSQKLILMTNKWVWNSPIFGGVVRLADYYPVTEGAEDSVDRLRASADKGFSIVIFPEGTRSEDGTLRRFHKGAFYLSEKLQLPIQPLLILGARDGVPKGTFYISPTTVFLKYLPLISADAPEYGKSYTERTKKISQYFKNEYAELRKDTMNPDVLVNQLVSNYLYKGPVLEWYLRVKLMLERNYQTFHNLVPLKAKILDLGCGYGFLPYMLSLLSSERIVTGVDYDEEKIAVADHGYLKNERTAFYCGDVVNFDVSGFDVIIIADVLHYLAPASQEQVLRNCFSALPSGGKLIIRDGDADLKERHQGTKLTELFSVNLLKFNKSEQGLHFISGSRLKDLASEYGLSVAVLDETRLTSNVIFVISKLE